VEPSNPQMFAGGAARAKLDSLTRRLDAR
jgi:hypothetical protein